MRPRLKQRGKELLRKERIKMRRKKPRESRMKKKRKLLD